MTTDKVTTRPPTKTIPHARLDRMRRALFWGGVSGWLKNNGDDVPAKFGYDHGNMLVTAKSGKKDLLFEHNGDSLRSNACRVLYEFDPETTAELMRGYQIARSAGLLGEHKPPCPEVAEAITDAHLNLIPDALMDRVYEAIRLKHRREGLY